MSCSSHSPPLSHTGQSRMVGQEEFELPLARLADDFRFGVHDHAVGDWQRTAYLQLRSLLDLDQAHAAGGLEGQSFVITEGWDLDAVLLSRPRSAAFPFRPGMACPLIVRFTSSGHELNRHHLPIPREPLLGNRPRISRRSRSSASPPRRPAGRTSGPAYFRELAQEPDVSRAGCRHRRTAAGSCAAKWYSSRHGNAPAAAFVRVEPHDPATFTISVVSSITTMPPEPEHATDLRQRVVIHRDVALVGLEDRARSAGDHGFQFLAARNAARDLLDELQHRINSNGNFVDAGLIHVSRDVQQARTAILRRAERRERAPPSRMMGGIALKVSTLLSSVGLAHAPATAGNGGFMRGIPRLPSSESSKAVSSPHSYAPAPECV